MMKFNQILTLFFIALLVVPLGLAQESTEEHEYEVLRAEYRDYRDDYSYYSRRYDDAVEDDDRSDIRYYRRQLDDVHDDLGDLDDEVDDLTDDVRDDLTIPNRSDLLDDLDDLEDDIRGLQRRIVNTIDDDTDPWSQLIIMPPEEEVEEVVVPQLVFVDIDRPAVEEVADGWSETRALLWLGVGILVALALIIFLVIALARK